MSAPRRGNLSNVLFQVLKFLLVTVAIYQIGLREQLGLNLDDDFSLVNATPVVQLTETGRFTVSFYVLHFFRDYKFFTVEASAQPDGKSAAQPLTPFGGVPARFEQPGPGTGTPHYFSLEYVLPPGMTNRCLVRYAVTFDGNPKTKHEVARIQVKHIPPVDPKGLVVPTPLSVVRGQRCEMPENLLGMNLWPASESAEVKVVSEAERVWIESRNQSNKVLPVGTSNVAFRTRATVAGVDTNKKTITVETVGRPAATVDMAHTALYRFPPSGAAPRRISLDDLSNLKNPGIVFTGAVKNGLIAPLQEVRVGDPQDPRMHVTLTLVVGPNRPPEPVYTEPGSRTFNARCADFFGNPTLNLANRYLNLNRIIVDPDGKSPSTGAANIRVAFAITADAGRDDRGLPFKVIRAWDDSGDYYLEAPGDIYTIMAKHPMAVPLSGIRVFASDEMGSHEIPLQIWR